MKSIVISTGLILMLAASAAAQVAAGGVYTLDQSLIAAGGGMNSTGGAYTLDGAAGEASAGGRSTASTYTVAGGFFSALALAPTAAGVKIGGRVVGIDGAGLQNTSVTLSGGTLSAPRTARTGSFGYFTFEDVEAGRVYTITVNNRRYGFSQPVQVISVSDSVTDIIFQASWEN